MRFITSIVDSWRNSADTSGAAPTMSPLLTTTLCGVPARSAATSPASAGAPPAGSRSAWPGREGSGQGSVRALPSRWPWKSLNAMTRTVTCLGASGNGADTTVGAAEGVGGANTAGGGTAQPAPSTRAAKAMPMRRTALAPINQYPAGGAAPSTRGARPSTASMSSSSALAPMRKRAGTSAASPRISRTSAA